VIVKDGGDNNVIVLSWSSGGLNLNAWRTMCPSSAVIPFWS